MNVSLKQKQNCIWRLHHDTSVGHWESHYPIDGKCEEQRIGKSMGKDHDEMLDSHSSSEIL